MTTRTIPRFNRLQSDLKGYVRNEDTTPFIIRFFNLNTNMRLFEV